MIQESGFRHYLRLVASLIVFQTRVSTPEISITAVAAPRSRHLAFISYDVLQANIGMLENIR
jgi:hypothetical protein